MTPEGKPSAMPILVATRNDSLQSIVDATPAERRGDLVFMQARRCAARARGAQPLRARTRRTLAPRRGATPTCVALTRRRAAAERHAAAVAGRARPGRLHAGAYLLRCGQAGRDADGRQDGHEPRGARALLCCCADALAAPACAGGRGAPAAALRAAAAAAVAAPAARLRAGTRALTQWVPCAAQGLTAACGKWAPAVAARLHRQGLACHVLDKQARAAARQVAHAAGSRLC
jgi:hypothetical protein